LRQLSRQIHSTRKWKETTPVYLTAEFKLPAADDGDDGVELSVVHGDHLPPNDVIQAWHRNCCRQKQFATHIHLACIWPGDAMCLVTISPHIFAGISPIQNLSRTHVFDDWILTNHQFKTRWCDAVQVYRGPVQPSSNQE
jgi:hypothetical protein